MLRFCFKITKTEVHIFAPIDTKEFYVKKIYGVRPSENTKVFTLNYALDRQIEYLREIGFMQRNYASMVSLGFISSNQCI